MSEQPPTIGRPRFLASPRWVTLELELDDVLKLDDIKRRRGVSRNHLIRSAVSQYLDREQAGTSSHTEHEEEST